MQMIVYFVEVLLVAISLKLNVTVAHVAYA